MRGASATTTTVAGDFTTVVAVRVRTERVEWGREEEGRELVMKR